MADTMRYTVPGIHCDHCARAIRDELSTVAGVDGVDVDLESKVVTVRGEALSDRDVREAIAEAGYEAV